MFGFGSPPPPPLPPGAWLAEVEAALSAPSVQRCYADPNEMVQGTGKCSKCKTVRYRNKEAQRQHWKVHKKYCCPPDLDAVATMDARACVAHLQSALTRPTKDTAVVIHRLGWLLYHDQVDDASDIGFQIHTMTRMYLPNEQVAAAIYSSLWAVPGMVQVLLGAPLLSRSVKERDDMRAEAAAEGREVDPNDDMR